MTHLHLPVFLSSPHRRAQVVLVDLDALIWDCQEENVECKGAVYWLDELEQLLKEHLDSGKDRATLLATPAVYRNSYTTSWRTVRVALCLCLSASGVFA